MPDGAVACRAVIVRYRETGATDATGSPIYVLGLTVMPPDGSPYPLQIGAAVQPAALAVLHPGSHVPATVRADDPNALTIDWDAALAAT